MFACFSAKSSHYFYPQSLFRTLNLKVPLTSVQFSPEGAAIYLGTVNGKLLIMDLRGLDKPPRSIVINEGGARIETMVIQVRICVDCLPRYAYPNEVIPQKKVKGSPEPSTKLPTTSKPAVPTEGPNPIRSRPSAGAAKPSPARARLARVGSDLSPARRLPSTLRSGPATATNKKVFSPVRDPLGNSGGSDISGTFQSLHVNR